MRKIVPLVLLLLLAVAGCRTKLNQEKVVTVEAGDGSGLTIEAIKNAQTVKIAATANSGTFNVYCYLAKDKAEVENNSYGGKAAPKLLDSKLKVINQAELSANVPANEEAVVMITSGDGKKAEVKLKVTN